MIVADAGPLIAFARSGHLHLLHRLFDQVVIPDSVFGEVVGRAASRPGTGEVLASSWIRAQPVAPAPTDPPRRIHKGEWDAIRTAQQLGVVLLVDDKRARAVAESLGVEIVGSLGVLADAKKQGLIPRVAPIIAGLVASGYWIRPGLAEAFLAGLGENGDG